MRLLLLALILLNISVSVYAVGLDEGYFDIDAAHKNPRVCVQVNPNSFGDTDRCFNVEIADYPEERLLGLMYRKYLAKDNGMVFVFPSQSKRSFWMKNTLIPLDIIYIDKTLRIRRIIHQARPCIKDPCPTYPSNAPVQYTLEINAGLSKKYGIKEGQRVNFYSVPYKSDK